MSAIAYRPDIDGLRTLAVMAVVLFHAFPTVLPGGFIGVDVFFVISGYLITTLLIKDHALGRYSIRQFYARRIRRIFPALLTVLLASLAFGWIVLTAEEYEQLGKHVAGGAAFLANFIFYREAGYFDNAADTKPMLHLWSLGVEEQFYIVWPLMLPFILRLKQPLMKIALIGLLAISLVYSAWLVVKNPSLAFYSPVSRFWELGAGATLAIWQFVYRSTSNETAPSLLLRLSTRELIVESSTGLALLGLSFSIGMLSETAPFPGMAALPAVAASVILIAVGQRSRLTRALFANRLVVAVGLVSYPIYLWHWPLLSYARIMESGIPSTTIRTCMVLATLVLAVVTYRFIEQPVRSQVKGRYVIPVLGLMMVLVFAVGLFIKKQDGLSQRHHGLLNADPATLDIGKGRVNFERICGLDAENAKLFQYCLQSPGGQPGYALFGDSKGEALFYGLLAESSRAKQWMLIGSVTAPAREGVIAPDERAQNKALAARDLIVQSPDIHTVVLAIALRSIFAIEQETGFPARPDQLSQRVSEFSDLIGRFEGAGKRVIFYMDNPTFPDPKSCISGGMTRYDWANLVLRRIPNPRCEMTVATYRRGVQLYLELISQLKVRHPRLEVIDPLPALCEAEGDVPVPTTEELPPESVCRVTRRGEFLYSYSDHLSWVASRRIARLYFAGP